MIEAAETAQSFIVGRQRADLDSDRMLLFALVRAVEILGEAASNLSAEAQASDPLVPWRSIIGMRNRMIHAYFSVDPDILWKTVRDEIPPLLSQLKAVLPND
jgi:uncharacterized protein with HEPN domain